MAEQDTSFGPNAWLVDEMYDQYRADPSSVSESWRDFFADERDGEEPAKEPVQTATDPAQDEKPARKEAQAKVGGTKRRDDDTKDRQPAPAGDEPEPIRGA